MKWIAAAVSSRKETYELWHDDKKLLTLEFHPSTNSARIEYADEKRVFLIRKEGFLKNKTVLRNEYGVRMGRLGYENGHGSEGFIELNDEKFSYSIDNNPLSEISIYRDNKEKPFVVCGLRADKGNTSVQFSKSGELSPPQHFLLMSLCWYLFLPVAKENTVEYAL